MTRRNVPFSAAELPVPGGRVRADTVAAAVTTGRMLERFASAQDVGASAGFSTRVMAAIADEPAPHPALVFGLAVAAARPVRMLAAMRDAWRVSVTGNRPGSVRAQALALVLLTLLAVGSMAAIAGAAAVQMLDRPAEPSPSPVFPIVEPPSTDPSEATEPDASASSTLDEPIATPEPSEGASESAATPKPTAKTTPKPPRQTPRPTVRATPRETASPTSTDEPSDSPSPDGEPTPTSTDNSGPGSGLDGSVDLASSPDATGGTGSTEASPGDG